MKTTEIYPGHGACEICGEADPCNACVGVQMPAALLEKAGRKIDNLLKIKLNNDFKEKFNTVLSSVIKK